MITESTAKVYLAPTRGRRFLTLDGAIRAEAKALIYKKYPSDIGYYEGDLGYSEDGYDIYHDDYERYQRMHKKMCVILKRLYKTPRQQRIV
jgi:hypothetical protein